MAQTDLFRRTDFAAAMAAMPVQAIDIGARAGFEPDLLPIAFAVDAVGFEPEPEAFAALDGRPADPWRSQRHLPTAVSGRAGPRTLHINADPASTSLLPAVAKTAAMHHHVAWSETRATATVETDTLDAALARFGIPAPDFIKLDVEGAEGEILAAAPGALAAATSVKVEVGFMPLREGQFPAHAIARLMDEAGFMLIDLIRPARWRQRRGVIHPQMTPGPAPYSRGRLAHGDFLFFRDPDTLGADGARAARAAWVAMTYGYFDHAAALLAREDAAAAIAPHLPGGAAAALRGASRLYGRRAWTAALGESAAALRPFLRGALAWLRA
jgi:FkbM family methyltransferase